MEEGGMIEPDHFTGHGMLRYRRTYLPGSQVIPSPFSFNASLAAVGFDNRLILSLKYCLPREGEVAAEVPDQHPLLFDETPPDFRTNAFEDFAAVRNRRLSALFRRLQTKEEDFQWP